MKQDKSVSTSLIKALDIISYLSGHAEGLRLPELVAGSGLPRSTVIRILQTLQDYGLVEKQSPGRYLLTGRFRALANPDRYAVLRERYRPLLQAISAEVKELVLVGLREGAAIIHIDYLEWDHAIRVAPTPQTRHPWHKHALGKLAMSLQPGILEQTKNRRLRAELEEIQRTGVAWNREESERGMVALATWGLEKSPAEPMIAVAWPSFRFTEAAAAKAVQFIKATMLRERRRSL
jgi:DNA-binding IclR family transcriptional regulator